MVKKCDCGEDIEINENARHKVLCGDSTNPEDFERLCGDFRADMVFTDPPYNVNYSGTGENTSNTIMNDNMSDASFQEFLTKAFEQMARYSEGGAAWYVFHSPLTQDHFRKAINETNWKVKTQLIWNKPSAGMGMNEYRPKHEPFFYCTKENANFYGDRTGTSVWDFQKSDIELMNWAKKMKKMEAEGKTTIWTMKREPTGDYVHPTQKPVELIQRAIVNSTQRNEKVLDPFLGSGSTLIASDKTGRVCYGMELDPKYVDIIIQRYVDYTNNETIIKNGQPMIWKKTVEKTQE
jgi:DNA modification methylase